MNEKKAKELRKFCDRVYSTETQEKKRQAYQSLKRVMKRNKRGY